MNYYWHDYFLKQSSDILFFHSFIIFYSCVELVDLCNDRLMPILISIYVLYLFRHIFIVQLRYTNTRSLKLFIKFITINQL